MGVVVNTDLEFLNPTFRPGVNVTVRSGRKWDMIVDVLPKNVMVRDGGQNKVIGDAKIVGKLVMPAIQIPTDILNLEHDSGCRNLIGLWKAMRKAYGPTWDIEQEVTVLFFTYEGLPF